MKHHLGIALLAGTSALAVAWTANAQTATNVVALEEVVVTGSRVIANGNDSPNPVTVVTMEEIMATKPTTVFEALQEMPLFSAGRGGAVAGSTGQGGNNNSIAGLNLRALGPTRGLILYDGHRVPPQNADGTTDINQIPQMLLQRVDVQTGGASAVYGSDAITGVVNFVTNRNFNGIKAQAQTGITEYGDDQTYELGIAAGTDLFGGRGHLQGSVQYHDEEGLLRTERSYVQEVGKAPWSLQGNGTAAAPYFITRDARDSSGSFGGKIVNSAGNPYNNFDFASNGVLTQFVNGSTAGTTGTNQIGGNGGFASQKSSLKADNDFMQVYGRFDFDVTDNLHFFLTSFYDLAHQFTWLSNTRSNSGASSQLAQGFRMTTQNAFLPTAYRDAMLTAAGNPTFTTFNVGKYFSTDFVPPSNTDYTNKNLYINTGLEGSFGDGYKWEVAYTDSHVEQANIANNSWNTARLFASLDSVLVNGQPTCWVATQAQYAGMYPGCVPMNIFGPSATNQAAVNYVVQPTEYVGITDMQDASGFISGAPFSTWAGPVNMALSAEWRKLTYELTSEGEPANVVALDCNALGIPATRTACIGQTATNIGTATIFPNGTAGRTPVWQTVKEAALEADLPLLKDQRFAQAVDLNLAARFADYSSTGSPVASIPYSTQEFSATTWKAGIDWHFNDAVTARATRSRDFRAPNLNDLYLPGRVQGFNQLDQLTGISQGTQQQIGGNPDLDPEVGNTTTLGIVFKPTANFSLAIDAFDISITDAITSVNGTGTEFQTACYASGGASPYCTLQVRPLGNYTDKSPANTATLWYTAKPLNIAEVNTSGVDVEANYQMELAGRPLSLRALATYQPHIWSMQPGLTTSDAGGVSSPAVRATVFIRYNLTDALTFNWSTRWRSELANADPRVFVVRPDSLKVDSVAYSNLNLSYRFNTTAVEQLDVYLNVQNVFNQTPPAYAPVASPSPASSGAGQNGVGFYPSDDALGRAYYVGARVKF